MAKLRRGKELESSLNQAIYDELLKDGYENLTMAKVAERAHTSRTVLYRRWSNKAEMVQAAIQWKHQNQKNNYRKIPETGSLENDLKEFLQQQILEKSEIIDFDTFRALFIDNVVNNQNVKIGDFFKKISVNAFDNSLFKGIVTILKNADTRHEVIFKNLSPEAIQLPIVLLMYHLFQSFDIKWIDATVHNILMPVYTNSLKSSSVNNSNN